MINISINDQNYEVDEGLTVLQAAAQVGITIPTLCYHKDLSPFGGCRLCVVQVRGARLPMTACNLPVSPVLEVRTETESVVAYRRAILRLLLKNYYDAGYKRVNGKTGLDEDSELAYWCRFYGVDIAASMAKKPRYPVDSDPNPFVWVDMNKCIQCTRCERACAEVQGRFVWSQAYRGYQARIVAGADSTMLASRCESCGACVAYCPTGALDNKMSVSAGRADRLVQTTCGYCGVGCQLDLNVKDDVPGGRVIRVTSHTEENGNTVNGLHLCLKGRYGYGFIHDERRHTRPQVREYLLKGTLRPKDRGRWVTVDWDTALEAAAKGLRAAHSTIGGDAIGVLASGRLTNEESYLLNKLARQALGSHNIDCSAHIYTQCEIDGLIDTLGLPAMPGSFDAIAEHSGALLVIGSNLTEQHPVFGAKIRQAVLRRKLQVVVAGPDFINMAEYAALALYHHPKTEAALVNGLMHILLQNDWVDRAAIDAQPREYAEFSRMIADWTPRRTAEVTGVPVEALFRATEILATHPPLAIVYSVGLANPQTGTEAARSLANLGRLLGSLEQPGGGVHPLRTQNNLQGACDMGCRPDWLPGYQPAADAAARRKFEHAWGASLPDEPGLDAAEMLAAAKDGRIRALYILGEDVLNTSPQATQVRFALQACDFVLLQEILPSETTCYADVLLPGVSFAEKDGSFTSAERRIQRVRAATRPVGEARPDGEIITALARKLLAGGGRTLTEAEFAGWDYATPEAVLREIGCLAPVYDGVTYDRLDRGEAIQWPARLGMLTGGELRWKA